MSTASGAAGGATAGGTAAAAVTCRQVSARLVTAAVRECPSSRLPQRANDVPPLGKVIGSSYQTDPDKKLRYEKVETVEGRLTRTVYVIPEGRSTLEVVRNYTNELEGKGAKTLFQCSKAECGEDFHKLHGVPRALKPEGSAYNRARLDLVRSVLEYVDPAVDQRLWVGKWPRDNGSDVYASIYAATQTGGSMGDISAALKGRVLVMLDVLETKAMQQNLAFVSAEQIGGALGKDGRVALYGILFDFDKADIKPESDKQLVEMANLLKSTPGLKVFIVGHTDNKGACTYNTDLSQRRAECEPGPGQHQRGRQLVGQGDGGHGRAEAPHHGLALATDVEQAGVEGDRHGKAGEDEVGGVVERVADRLRRAEGSHQQELQRMEGFDADEARDEADNKEGQRDIDQRQYGDFDPARQRSTSGPRDDEAHASAIMRPSVRSSA